MAPTELRRREYRPGAARWYNVACTAQAPHRRDDDARAHPGRAAAPGLTPRSSPAAASTRRASTAPKRACATTRAVPRRRGRLDVLRAAVGAEQRALGGAYPAGLRLQRQGVRRAHRPPRRAGPLPDWLRALPARRRKRNVYARTPPRRRRRGLETAPRGLEPLVAAGSWRCPLPVPAVVLARRDNATPSRLPRGCPADRAVEFRGGGWMETAAGGDARLLEDGLAYVCVDEPQGPPEHPAGGRGDLVARRGPLPRPQRRDVEGPDRCRDGPLQVPLPRPRARGVGAPGARPRRATQAVTYSSTTTSRTGACSNARRMATSSGRSDGRR